MIIENRMVVTLNYRLTVNENGSEVEVEKTTVEKPFVFLYGAGQLLPDFESNLSGKAPGDVFDFHISAENGYGLSDAQNIVPIPITVFAAADGKPDTELLKVDNILPMSDNSGNKYQGRVKEVTEEQVIMDFNHPLSDKELHFKGEVVEVRLATMEELQHGHVHGPGGHHH
ncbi:MAG: FKBP-type peptidyl-prolyl cis-trans isomerase [Chitinophagales bacterium]